MLEAGPKAVPNFGLGDRTGTAKHPAGEALRRRIPVWNLEGRLRTATAGPEAGDAPQTLIPVVLRGYSQPTYSGIVSEIEELANEFCEKSGLQP